MNETFPAPVGFELEFADTPRPAAELAREVFERHEVDPIDDTLLGQEANVVAAEESYAEDEADEARQTIETLRDELRQRIPDNATATDAERTQAVNSALDAISGTRRRPRRRLNITSQPEPSPTQPESEPPRGHKILDRIQLKMQRQGYDVTNYGAYRRTPYSASIWDLKTDSSCGYEAASPAISTYSELVRHSKVATIVKESGGKVDDRCGFHLHLGARDLDLKHVEAFLKLCIRYESAFFMLVSEQRRSSKFCRALPDDYIARIKSAFRQNLNLEYLAAHWPNKNTWLNCQSFRFHRTLEIRIMDGTLDPEFIQSYALFMVHVLDSAMKGRQVRWGQAKAKDGATLLRTLLGAAGFYEPVTEIGHDSDRAIVARKWANKRAKRMNSALEVPRLVHSISETANWDQIGEVMANDAATIAGPTPRTGAVIDFGEAEAGPTPRTGAVIDFGEAEAEPAPTPVQTYQVSDADFEAVRNQIHEVMTSPTIDPALTQEAERIIREDLEVLGPEVAPPAVSSTPTTLEAPVNYATATPVNYEVWHTLDSSYNSTTPSSIVTTMTTPLDVSSNLIESSDRYIVPSMAQTTAGSIRITYLSNTATQGNI